MLPIPLNYEYVRFVLVGNGRLAVNRLTQLLEAGVKDIRVFSPAPSAELKKLYSNIIEKLPSENDISWAHIVYIVDLDANDAEHLAQMARDKGTLVNVEDNIPFCDFHTPSIVRRGDLIFSISTKGKSPTLAKRLRCCIGNLFKSDWDQKLDRLHNERMRCREQNMAMKDVANEIDRFITKTGWLKNVCECQRTGQK